MTRPLSTKAKCREEALKQYVDKRMEAFATNGKLFKKGVRQKISDDFEAGWDACVDFLRAIEEENIDV